MENFRALAVQLASSDPDRPLTESRKALIEKRLRDFFPDFHTPNHPTYASMIYRAIMELKEPEGSTEESISEFIRKRYDDLPWAHFTLLKHHLQKLCESGEIVVTSNECYLVADGITSLNSGPYSSREREIMQQMRKRRENKLRGRARRRRKVQIKENNQPAGEQMEGQDQVEEQHNQLIEEQNVTEEPRSDLIEELNVLCAREQEQQSVLIEEQNQLEGQVMDSEHLEQNQPKSPSLERPPGFNLVKVKELSGLQEQQLPEGSPLSSCQQKNPKLQLERVTTSFGLPMSVLQLQVEQQHEYPYPLEPPDPQLVEQEQQSKLCNSGRPLELCAQEKTCKPLPMTSTSLALPLNSEPPEQCKLDLPNSGRILDVQMTTKGGVGEFSPTLQQILEEQRQLRHQNQRQSEHKQLTTEAMMQQRQGKKRGQKKQSKSRPEAIITQDVPMNSSRQLEFPNTGRSSGPETLTASLDLPDWSEKQPDCSVPEKPMVLDLVTMEQSSQTELFQRVKQHGERKMTRSESETARTQDLPMNSEQLAELPNSVQCQRLEIRTVETISRAEKQQAVTAALDVPKYPEQQPDASVPGRPIELNLATMDQSSQTERMRRQLQRWCQSTSKSKPPTTSITELLPSEFQYQEPELQIEESPPEIKHTQVEESTQTTEQQANLSGGQKQIKSQPKIITDFNMPIAPQKLEQKQPPELPNAERAQKLKCKQKQEKPQHRQLRPRPPKPEQATAKLPNMGTLQELKQKPSEELIQRGQKKPKPSGLQMLSEQKTRTDSLDSLLALLWKPEQQPVFPSPKRAKKQQDKQAQENPQHMKLRTRCPKSEATTDTTTAQSEPVQDQHEEQQQLDCQDGGRPLERKSDMTSTVVESSPSDHQNQHEHQQPAPRGRGRPRKYIPDDTTMQNVFPSEKKLQQAKRQGQGRPRKLNKGK
ncbi:hypothetical protein CsSME_00043355 [Camellia sinensis var. sinensis]